MTKYRHKKLPRRLCQGMAEVDVVGLGGCRGVDCLSSKEVQVGCAIRLRPRNHSRPPPKSVPENTCSQLRPSEATKPHLPRKGPRPAEACPFAAGTQGPTLFRRYPSIYGSVLRPLALHGGFGRRSSDELALSSQLPAGSSSSLIPHQLLSKQNQIIPNLSVACGLLA